MGKIATDLERALAIRDASGAPGGAVPRLLATGDGWCVEDVICTSGPADHAFEERHERVSVAIVVAGSFEYRTPFGRELMTPGSMMLGNPGQCFECGHEHAAGDRCVSFHFAPWLFERLAADAGARRGERRFRAARVPPVRASAPLISRASLGLSPAVAIAWDEMALAVATGAIRLASDASAGATEPTRAAIARVTETIRRIEHSPGTPWTLDQLAHDAGQSAFHYLRTFRRIAGATPHQFIVRARLRAAALDLATDDAKVIEIALRAGFDDISNFNRAFRAEFGVAPREYRRRSRR